MIDLAPTIRNNANGDIKPAIFGPKFVSVETAEVSNVLHNSEVLVQYQLDYGWSSETPHEFIVRLNWTSFSSHIVTAMKSAVPRIESRRLYPALMK